MKEVVESVRRVSDIISEITAAGTEQSAGIEQINVAVTQMDQMTQQNAALVEEAAAAAGALQDQAQNLSRVVSVFKLDQTNTVSSKPELAARSVPAKNTSAKPAVRSLPKPAVKAAKSAATRKEPVAATGEWEEF